MYESTSQKTAQATSPCDDSSLMAINEAQQRYCRGLEEMFKVARAITTTTDIKALHRVIVTHAKALLTFDFSSLLLVSEKQNSLIQQDYLGFPQYSMDGFSLKEGQGLATYTAKKQEPASVADFSCETRFSVPQVIWDLNIRSALAVPMIIEGEVIGILIGHTLELRHFSQAETDLYTGLANQAALALHNAWSVKKLQESEERFHDLFDNSLDLIQITGGDGRLIYVNQAWQQTLGYHAEEAVGRSVFDIIHPEEKEHCLSEFQRLCLGQESRSVGTAFCSKSGEKIPVEGNINCRLSNNRLISTRGIFRNISERKKMEARLREMIISDELTGLLNRRGFFSQGRAQLAIAERNNSPLLLLYADLDNMKAINDLQGHETGDQALIATATLLKNTFRQGDLIARLGGDEFVVLLTSSIGTDPEESVLSKLEHQLNQFNEQNPHPYRLEISLGLARYQPENPCTFDQLLSQADQQMYEQKKIRKERTRLS